MIGEQLASFHPILSSSCPTTFGQRAGQPVRCPAATRQVPRTRRRNRKHFESHSRPTPKHRITRRPRSLRSSKKALRGLGRIRAIPSTCTRASIPSLRHLSPTDTARESVAKSLCEPAVQTESGSSRLASAASTAAASPCYRSTRFHRLVRQSDAYAHITAELKHVLRPPRATADLEARIP